MVAGKMMILSYFQVNYIHFKFKKIIFIKQESTLPVYPDTLPEKVTLSSRGPAADTHPTAMGVYSRLQGLPPVWEHSISPGHKLFFDGKKNKFELFHLILFVQIRHKMDRRLHF